MAALHEVAASILARHREAGTAEAEQARDVVARHLTTLGYRVSLQHFRFHPSALLGFPILGAGIGAAALLGLPLLALPGVPGWGALAVWSLVLAATVCLSVGVAAGWLNLGEARQDANLLAVRGDGAPRRWIVAHLDTKAQAQSMAGRLVAVWVMIVAVGCGTGLAVARLGRAAPSLGGGHWSGCSRWSRVPSPAAVGCAERLAVRGTTGAASWLRSHSLRRRTTPAPAS